MACVNGKLTPHEFLEFESWREVWQRLSSPDHIYHAWFSYVMSMRESVGEPRGQDRLIVSFEDVEPGSAPIIELRNPNDNIARWIIIAVVVMVPVLFMYLIW